jgi:hypothetical protein
MINIRQYSLFVGLSAILMVVSCTKKDAGFDMFYRKQFNVPIGQIPQNSFNYDFLNIAADTSAFFTPNGVGSAQIVSIKPKSMSIIAQYGGVDYNTVRSVEVWISTPNAPNITPQIIFFRDDVPLTTNERIDLVPNDVDVKSFITFGKFNVKVTLRFRDNTTRTLESDTTITFFAKI